MAIATIVLLKVLGPYFIIMGLAMLINKDHFGKMLKKMDHMDFMFLFGAAINIGIGFTLIQFHNTWNSLPEIFVSLIIWIILIKGVLLALAPNQMKKLSAAMINSNFITGTSILMIILGIYLSASGF